MIVDGKQKVYKVDYEVFHWGTAIGFHFIGGKWKSIIIWYLRHGALRFSQVKKLIPDITDKMLSIQLKALHTDGLVEKKVYGSKPPYRVEYWLTEFGQSILPVIEKITEWGIAYAEKNGSLMDIEDNIPKGKHLP